MATSVIDDNWMNADKVHWLKGVLIMQIIDKAIRPFVEKEITKFHNNIKSNWRICGNCMSTNARNCRSDMCSKITTEIELNHRFFPGSRPCYMNSQITKWLSDPWEIAKCYMPRSKHLQGLPGSDIGFVSVLNVVINNKHFEGLIPAVDLRDDENIFCKVKHTRNNLMRTNQMTEDDLKDWCDICIDIVKEIGTDKAEYLRQIEKVRDEPFSITAEHIHKYMEQAERNDRLVEAEMNELMQKDMVEEFSMLHGIGKINEQSVQIYLKALEEGTEPLKHIRLMVVGMFGVGKTSLIRRLREESIDGVQSTEGIDVDVNTCALNEDGTWISQTSEESKDSKIDERLIKLMSNTTVTTAEASTSQSTDRIQNMDQSLPQAPNTNIPMLKSPDPKLIKNAKTVLENLPEPDKVNPYSDRKPTISIWDFAGQAVYYSTHQFFLSSRSIYLLVLDISKPLEDIVNETEDKHRLILEGSMKKDYTCLDAFKFWVTSIYAYTLYRVEKGQQYKPTIVLVGTRGDLLVGNIDQKERMKDEYFSKAREYFDETPIDELFHDKTFLVSCTKDAEDVFNNLKKNITEVAKKQPYWECTTPAKWIPLERSIEGEKRNGKELMKFSEVAKADEENDYNLTDEPEIKLFLQMQHFLGNVIYFDAEDLDRTIILDPKWLIKIFNKFVTHRSSVPNKLRKWWLEYTKTAKLHKDLLDYITKTDEDRKNDSKVNESVNVVRYMEHLDVIAKPISEEEVNFHIVPCVLKQLTPEEYETNIRHLVNPRDGKSTYVLCFTFKDGCLPPSVFHRLMATYIKKMQIKKCGEKLLLYNGFGAFKLTSTKTLCIWYADFIIFARVTLHDKKNDIFLTDECIDIRKELSVAITNYWSLINITRTDLQI